MPRVAGCDPGTSSLDVLILDDGTVRDQVRFPPADLAADPELPVRWLRDRRPFDLVAGPSGYGLPLVSALACTDRDLELMSLVRPDERGRARGVSGFSAVARAFRDSGLPVVFLPGVIHLPTVPAHRKLNKIDLGTPDKVCVAALAIDRMGPSRYRPGPVCVVELGSAFTACLVIGPGGDIVDGLGGTSGPLGWLSGGAWDGEAAYLLSPLAKEDLFRGGAADIQDEATRLAAYREAVVKAVAGLAAVHGADGRFDQVVLSGRRFEEDPAVRALALDPLLRHISGGAEVLRTLPGAWVKEAAQGAVLIADGLAGGQFAPVVDGLWLREASGTALDWLTYPRADEVRRVFGVG